MSEAPAVNLDPSAPDAPALQAAPALARPRSIKVNLMINIAGAVIPLGVSLVTVPIYIRHIGDARYGVLSIVWVLLGYLGFLDFGLSRAAVRSLARRKDAPQEERAQVLVTTVALNLCLGLLGSVVLATLGSYLLQHVLSVPDTLKPEIARALPWIVALFPLALVGGVGIGTLESRERFGLANVLGVGGTAAGQILPVILAVIVGPSLAVVIPAAVTVRALTVLVVLCAVWRQERPLSLLHIDRTKARELLSYGSWLTVSGIISPVLVSLDQFVIGSLLGVSAATYYAVPMNLVMRSQVIATALERTVFPRLSHLPPELANKLARSAAVNLSSAFAVIVGTAVFLLKPIMVLWLGAAFADNTQGIGQILLVGAWVNGLAYIPGGLIQARGRPHLTAAFHCAELIPFVLLLYLLTANFGLVGVAIAWVLRVTADTGLMYSFSGILDRMLVLRIGVLFATMITAVVVERTGYLSLASRLGLAMTFASPGLILDFFSGQSLIRRFSPRPAWARCAQPAS